MEDGGFIESSDNLEKKMGAAVTRSAIPSFVIAIIVWWLGLLYSIPKYTFYVSLFLFFLSVISINYIRGRRRNLAISVSNDRIVRVLDVIQIILSFIVGSIVFLVFFFLILLSFAR